MPTLDVDVQANHDQCLKPHKCQSLEQLFIFCFFFKKIKDLLKNELLGMLAESSVKRLCMTEHYHVTITCQTVVQILDILGCLPALLPWRYSLCCLLLLNIMTCCPVCECFGVFLYWRQISLC